MTDALATRRLGSQGLEVSRIGLGCMGMSEFYGARDDASAVAAIDRALELGISMLDTADAYGPYTNEELIGRALRGRRSGVVVATKFGIDRSDGQRISGRPEYVHAACEASLRRLGVEEIDLYYQHRVDPEVPIEETVGAMSELVAAGKVRYLGLSEAAPEMLRRAHAVHPISALQTEYSLWERSAEDGVLPVARELGVGFVAYSPIGRGFLSGTIHSQQDLEPGDYRRSNPRFAVDNLAANHDMLERVGAIARELGLTSAQLALAWVIAQGDDVVPIPGTKRARYVEENAGAASVQLPAEVVGRIEAAFPKGAAMGDRYADMTFVRGWSPPA